MQQLRKVTRSKTKIRLGLSAVSGGGKTYTAILIAEGLCGDIKKVAIIDTENGSADLYEHLGEYNVLPLHAPYTPEKYIEAIKTCEDAGMEVIIIDSITHEWDGKGGCLEIVEAITQASSSKNSYTAWAKVTPRHADFIQAILTSKCHIITTVRRKQDYEMSKNTEGKTTVTKAGLKEITREGFEYELTINLNMDTGHFATASKDRTGLFMGKPEFVPSKETGKYIAQWCETGVDQIAEAIAQLKNCTTVEQLKDLKAGLNNVTIHNADFVAAATARYKEIAPPPAPFGVPVTTPQPQPQTEQPKEEPSTVTTTSSNLNDIVL